MSSPSMKAPTGTRDILAPESDRWKALIGLFSGQMERAGYGLVQSPMFEEIGVFQRVGEDTDVVRKEMYDFEDKGGRHLALRPEGTASIVRAFVQHHPQTPWKVWYAAPSFRYERPQAGRFRQHHQIGVEALGVDDADLDVEVISLAWDFFASVGLRRIDLCLNSLGDPVCRPAYLDMLAAHLVARLDDLCDEHRPRARENPMRVLDCKRASCREVTRDAPRTIDHLCRPCSEHFERIQEGLGALSIPFILDTRLARGFDYYTRTTFELQASALDGAQNAVGGGGRYDGLVEMMGGAPTPGMGFGIGVERTLLACDAEATFPVPPSSLVAFVIDVTGGTVARDLSAALRRAGVGVVRSFDDRSMRAQMKQADRSGASFALIIGPDELEAGTVAVRDLRGETGQHAVALEDVVAHVGALAKGGRQ
ncbi:MAG: histidine--tRNA ligase [Actinobacteria bacterium]|nr:histidine--tRNA ligase [Actinomycetota bacterium]